MPNETSGGRRLYHAPKPYHYIKRTFILYVHFMGIRRNHDVRKHYDFVVFADNRSQLDAHGDHLYGKHYLVQLDGGENPILLAHW
jgi:hypothetical protein